MLQLNNTYRVMRHGHSEANAAGIVVSAPQRGVNGYGLSARGVEQVEESLRQQHGMQPEVRIVSSDFLRARETAQVVHASLGCKHDIIYDQRLRERWFGDFDGGSAESYNQVWAQDVLDPSHHLGNVESVAEVEQRVASLVKDLDCDHANESFLLVAHGDVLQILLTVFRDLPASAHRAIEHLETAEIRLICRHN